ncbi:hypothetical protein D3C77_736530 [compost metagenome]
MSEGLQLSPTMLWWSKRRPGVSIVPGASSMLSSANSEKICADDEVSRPLLVRPSTAPPSVVLWLLALGSSSFCCIHSLPRVRV